VRDIRVKCQMDPFDKRNRAVSGTASRHEPGTVARLNSIRRSFLRQGAQRVGLGVGDFEDGVEFGDL
jgi:hypothetical protein